MIILSDRLKAITEMLSPCGVAADIGCDHCLTLLYIIQSGVCRRGIGTDLKPGPLEKARENVIEFGFGALVDLRLGSGLSKIAPGEADAIIISGMGGLTINGILTEGLRVAEKAAQLILQPQSHIPGVRKKLHELGFYITGENMVTDAGKYYNIIKASPDPYGINPQLYCDADYKFGRELIEAKNTVLKQFLRELLLKNEKILDALADTEKEKSVRKRNELKRENDAVKDTLARMK